MVQNGETGIGAKKERMGLEGGQGVGRRGGVLVLGREKW